MVENDLIPTNDRSEAMAQQNKSLIETGKVSFRQFLMETPDARDLYVNASSFKMKKMFKRLYLLPNDQLELFSLNVKNRIENLASV